MLFEHLKNFNLQEWLEANVEDWKQHKYVRRLIWDDSDYLVFLTNGDIIGELFHINPGDEIFFQLEGQLDFYYVTEERERKLMIVRPGEMFLLPARVPHAPRRLCNPCWTMVVERRRRPDDTDGFAWFCERCNNKVYEVCRKGSGPGDAVEGAGPPFIIAARRILRADTSLRTCNQCGEILSLPDDLAA